MSFRVPLSIIDGKLRLIVVVDCNKLRVRRKFVNFVVDTGSSDSFLSYADVLKMQIPLSNRAVSGQIDFGGSRFNRVNLPEFKMHLLHEDKTKGVHTLKTSFSALKTTRSSEDKMQVAQTLPSILGINFLKEQKASLHVVMSENLAYLEFP